MEELGFPGWLRATHFLNIIFMSFLIRSGIEILAAHPKLYWNDDCRHGSEWARFTKKEMPKDELWTSKDEEESYSSLIAMPGLGHRSGPARAHRQRAVGGPEPVRARGDRHPRSLSVGLDARHGRTRSTRTSPR